jgi:hypothetical protein
VFLAHFAVSSPGTLSSAARPASAGDPLVAPVDTAPHLVALGPASPRGPPSLTL